MKYLFSLLLITGLIYQSHAQHLSANENKLLKAKEDSMKQYALDMVQGINVKDRFMADSILTRLLVRSLKTPNSFYYPFDSLITVSCLYAPDSSFRIFSWQLTIDENLVRQHGAIQMHTDDGSLKLIPLIDHSDNIDNINDSIVSNKAWIGALYYKMVMKEHAGVKYYTLLGFDDNNIRSSRKYIEVLHFENGDPVFGGKFFSVPNDSIRPHNPSRFVMEFKKEAGPRLTYDKELDMIVMEHLVSESNQPRKKWTLIGDGDYEGFKWSNGRWIYVEKVFNQVTPEGQAPTPKPLNPKDSKLGDKR